jgi:glycosyltransferase involved in cell wall biosynthesis
MGRASVLIPSYNEARAIGGITRELMSRGFSVCVVDDGSTDGTSAIASGAGAFVIRHEKNMGKGAALIDGFAHLVKSGASEVLVMDGDGQHCICDIDNFFKKMDSTGADIVVGDRMSDTTPMPVSRKLTNRFMSYVISRMCGHDIPDTQCGFRLIKSGVLKTVKLTSFNYEIESELLFKAAKMRFRIESVPVKTIYKDEKSSINPVFDTLRFIGFLIRTAVGR